MKIGLYFGSFNPVHHGHLIIANDIINKDLVDQVWFVVSPHNPFKNAGSLLNEHQRKHLVELAILDEARLKVSSVEFSLPKPSYTIDTLVYLKEKFPAYSFEIIMGSDGLQNLSKWKNADLLIRDYNFLVYPRKNFEIKPVAKAKINELDAPLIEISSTHIRDLIKKKLSIKYLVPDLVKEEIAKCGYYK